MITNTDVQHEIQAETLWCVNRSLGLPLDTPPNTPVEPATANELIQAHWAMEEWLDL